MRNKQQLNNLKEKKILAKRSSSKKTFSLHFLFILFLSMILKEQMQHLKLKYKERWLKRNGSIVLGDFTIRTYGIGKVNRTQNQLNIIRVY